MLRFVLVTGEMPDGSSSQGREGIRFVSVSVQSPIFLLPFFNLISLSSPALTQRQFSLRIRRDYIVMGFVITVFWGIVTCRKRKLTEKN